MSNLSEGTLQRLKEQELPDFVTVLPGYSTRQLERGIVLTRGEWEQLKYALTLPEAVREELQAYIDKLPEDVNGGVVSVYISN